MPHNVIWVRSLEGVPLSFPSVSEIIEGTSARLSDAELAIAINEGLIVTEPEPAPTKRVKKGQDNG